MAAHAWEGYRINWQAEVLCKEKSGTERKVNESLLIRQHRDNGMNLDKGYAVSKLRCGVFPGLLVLIAKCVLQNVQFQL